MKYVLNIGLLLIIFSCRESINIKENPHILNDKILAYIDDYIQMDSIKGFNDKAFKVIVSKRYDYSLVRIFSIKYRSELIRDLPNFTFKRKGKVILVFNGLEDIIITDSLTNQQTISQLVQYLVDDRQNENDVPSKTFDPVVWEILIKKDSITLNKTPQNPFDYIFPEAKFIPPLE